MASFDVLDPSWRSLLCLPRFGLTPVKGTDPEPLTWVKCNSACAGFQVNPQRRKTWPRASGTEAARGHATDIK